MDEKKSLFDTVDRAIFGKPVVTVMGFLGRAGIAGLYLDAARYHVSHDGYIKTLSDMTSRGIPMPKVALIAAMIVSSALAVALLLGFRVRYAALGLALYTVCVSSVMYNPFAGLGQLALVFLLKDMAILGGLLAYAAESGKLERARIVA